MTGRYSIAMTMLNVGGSVRERKRSHCSLRLPVSRRRFVGRLCGMGPGAIMILITKDSVTVG